MRKAIEHLKTGDAKLAAVIERVGPPRIDYFPPDFLSLVRCIVYQQLSGKAAATIFARLKQAVEPEGMTPLTLARLSHDELRGLGVSNQKAKFLHDLSARTLDGTVAFERLPELPDDEVIAHLSAVKGVGVWTAQMFLMFGLRRPDVLPTGDLGIRNAMKRLYRIRGTVTADRMNRIGRPWRPYATYASWYLWRSLENSQNV
ncbi:MAG: DNA-3-methyladenine glycosylase 2 family protein [Candidatus Solibacter usitatus]|nr:DNA-3-methyladenine glycosylase 2 family protein [Candidatus Solibacter usitatus]